ncbi:MAG: mechanosensitive ion channel family protein [Clostridiales bacterium]|nr:mechanosensitive ion channel family protein [Clostridiales bacterium]
MNFETLLDTLIELACTVGLKILYAAAVLLVGWKLIKWLKRKIPQLSFMQQLDAGIRSFLSSALSILLYALLFISVAMIMGIPTTSFIAVLASFMAAIGLAIQGSLSNLIGGLMILMFKPFRAGDYISAPDISVEGTVKAITVVYTVLRTFDNIEVTVPNGSLANAVVKDMTVAETRRVDLTFRVDPAAPLEQVERVIASVLSANPNVLTDPAPSVVLTDITDSALLYGVRIWCPGDKYWDTRFALLRAIKLAFDENGIVMPHQQLDVHVNPQDR